MQLRVRVWLISITGIPSGRAQRACSMRCCARRPSPQREGRRYGCLHSIPRTRAGETAGPMRAECLGGCRGRTSRRATRLVGHPYVRTAFTLRQGPRRSQRTSYALVASASGCSSGSGTSSSTLLSSFTLAGPPPAPHRVRFHRHHMISS
jgi:hypothetical protein